MKRKEQYNVIIYGLGKTLKDSSDYIKTRFNVVGVSDRDLTKEVYAQKLGVPYIVPDELKNKEFDYIIIVSVYDEEISVQLVEDYGIQAEKVLRRIQWSRMLVHCEFGSKNQDKTFYVLSRPIHSRDGLFSFVFSYLEQLGYVEEQGYIPVVDMQSFANQYLEGDKVGMDNSWEYYFEPLSEYTIDEVYASKNVVLGYDEACYKGDYHKKYDIKKMQEMYQKYIKIKSDIMEIIDKEYQACIDIDKRTLGVLYRGTDMSSLKLKHHPVQPTVDEMIDRIYSCLHEWKCERIFLSTEDSLALARFKEEFGNIISCTNQRRFGNTGADWLANISIDRENDKYLRGLEYLTTIDVLSRCDCFLAGICAGSVCAEIINNGKYEHIEMVNLGEY